MRRYLTLGVTAATVEGMRLALAFLFALAPAGCSALLDFSGDLTDGGPADAPPAADADPTAPDAGPDPSMLFEPNNSFAEATMVEPGVTYGPIAIAPAGDHDFYKFTLDGPHDVTIDLTFMQTAGDLDLKLYDGAFTMIAPPSQGAVSNEQIVHTATVNPPQLGLGDYYIEVYGFNNAFTNDDYRLLLTVGP